MRVERPNPRVVWKWFRVSALVVVLSSCAQIMGFRHDVDDGACSTDQDCAPDKLCLLASCGQRCSQDDDCSLLFRCLKTNRGNACVDSRTGCTESCPSGTVCADDHTCRTTCTSAEDCLKGQVCPATFCKGKDEKHDPNSSDSGAGGASGTGGSGGDGGSSGGSGGNPGGTGGSSGAGAGGADAGPPVVDCDGNGSKETTLGTVTDCAACRDACIVTNGTGACVSRACKIASCTNGFEDCDHDYKTGCEADLASTKTCGTCDKTCVAPAGGSAACENGVCSVSSCPAGFEDCDGDYSTGCETPLNTLTDCGKCKTACSVPNGKASCVTGKCEIACACGTTVADAGADADASITSDASAQPVDAGAGCTPGKCTKKACSKGFGDCDDDPKTGCETDLTTSMSHCGSCHALCNYEHADEDCVAGVCTFRSCDTGWADCQNGLGDGCETDLSGVPNPQDPTAILHCGACGTNCSYTNGSALCVAQATSFVCQLNSCAATYFTTPDKGTCGCQIQPNVASASTCTGAAAVDILPLSTRTFTANVPDAEDDWYHFTLPNENASRSDRYRMRTRITVPAGFLMEVKDTSCSQGATKNVCPGEASNDPTSVTTWEWLDACTGTNGDPGANSTTQCNNLLNGPGFKAAPDEVWVRVYSKDAPTCATYDLTVVRQSF